MECTSCGTSNDVTRFSVLGEMRCGVCIQKFWHAPHRLRILHRKWKEQQQMRAEFNSRLAMLAGTQGPYDEL